MKLTRFNCFAGIVFSTLAIVGLEETTMKWSLRKSGPMTIADLSAESALLESKASIIRSRMAARIWLIHDWLSGDSTKEELVSRWIQVSADTPSHHQALRAEFPGLREDEIALLQIVSHFESFKELLGPKVWLEHVEDLAAHTAGP